MAIRSTRLPLVCAALMLGCGQGEQYDNTEADREAIDQVREQEIASINTGELSLEFITDDFVAMPPNQAAVTGREAWREWIETFTSQFTASISYPSTDLMIADDLAVERYTGILTVTPVEGGDSATETFKGIHVYQRQADRSWKLTHDVWNLD